MKSSGWTINNHGLTLIEVLVASVILVTVLAPLLGMFTTAARGYTRAGQGTIALNLARARMETCLAAGYDGLDNLAGVNPTWQTDPDNAGYEDMITVTPYDPLLEVKKLVVQVRPVNDPAGQVELATLVARWP
ncbi:type IV pilus modification PilV family protein [Moorella sp. Hama-1]|uniref:type IV pilus modification PilV family protein n=1 Tax=Moorella sp. Hama-1 TaxID=2138101 RepID=UPI000D64AAF0|nr:prepilin-type N-terminal cleavage/methylation domain-containing protein [Moorella sp. Hama-1]BCV21808.1 prepilin-type N-terminal cleavage/methylation domain-containing protein [Moorella sp. Hama-1]